MIENLIFKNGDLSFFTIYDSNYIYLKKRF